MRSTLAAALAATILTAAAPHRGASDEAASLLDAARGGDIAEVGRLLAEGVDPDAADRYGQTAIHVAAGSGHVEVLELLLDAGADPDRAETFYGTRPVDGALWRGQTRAAILLLRRGAAGRESALQAALASGDLELARAAIAGGPIVQSALDRSRAAEDLEPAFRELLAAAEARPDPPPPDYTLEQLHAFTGRFEGWTSDTLIEVVLREGRLFASFDGAPLTELTPRAEQLFSTADGRAASFFGRAETIEGIGFGGESLRRSVAEPVAGAAAATPDTAAAPADSTVHWPSFRGANASGVGDGVDVPATFDLASGEGVLWQAPVSGLGNSSPVVWGDRIFLTTAVAAEAVPGIRTGLTGSGEGHRDAVEHSWRVLAFDKRSGEKLWETEVARATPESGRHFKATQANSTPATDGRFLVVAFPTAGIACLDLDGNLLWRHDLGSLAAGAFTDPGIEWGFASSPVIYRDLAVLQVDVHAGQYLAAWNLASGEPVWRTERDVAPSWATPALVDGPVGDELVVNGSTIHAYDPATGHELWSLGPNSELVIATPVAGDGAVYVSAGYPPVKPIYAVPAGTRGDLTVEPGGDDGPLLWSHRVGGAYMPTPLLYRGLFYVVHHNGRIVAYELESGAAVYKSRFSRGGTFTGSPVAVNGRLFVPTEDGLLYVLAAGPQYEEIAINEIGEPLMATPAVSEGILLLRTPTRLIAVGASAG